MHLGFSYLEYKISEIRLGLSFPKEKFQYLNWLILSQGSQPKSQLGVEDTEKLSVVFGHAWLILVEFT